MLGINRVTESLWLDYERALKWVSQGAQPSEAVKRMLENRNEMAETESE